MVAQVALTALPETTARPHVVAILPRGEAIRNFVYTGALEQLADYAKVSVVSVLPSADTERLLKSRFENVYELDAVREGWMLKMPREILDLAHGRWLWSKAAQDRWRLRDLEAEGAVQQLKRLTKKLACYPFANKPGLALLSKLERTSSRWFCRTDHYVHLFRQLRPSLVFNGSHVHSAIANPAVEAAQSLGIPTATFIFSWDNLTSQGRIMLPYDFYLVWNSSIKDQLLKIYPSIRADQVLVTGTPQFDFHFKPEFSWSRKQFCDHVGADAARPIVLYSTGMANHMPGEPGIVESIADILKGMPELNSPQLLVRIYPKDRTGRFDELRQRRTDILFPEAPWEAAWLTPKLEDSYLLTNTLRHVVLGINVASTISLELCMFDKPVINVGYNPPGEVTGFVDYRRYYDFDHYRPLVNSGAVALANSEAELKEMIRRALTQPELGRKARRELIDRMFGSSLDGRAAARVSDSLLKLAEATPRND